MPRRRARIVAGGYPMHVILRGIDRAAIFFDDSDYRFFLNYLFGAADDESVGVHAYLLMTNHAHILMTAEGTAGIPRVMKGLGQRYAQHINRSYRRTGGLLETDLDASLRECTNGGFVLGNERFAQQIAAMVGRRTWKGYRWFVVASTTASWCTKRLKTAVKAVPGT